MGSPLGAFIHVARYEKFSFRSCVWLLQAAVRPEQILLAHAGAMAARPPLPDELIAVPRLPAWASLSRSAAGHRWRRKP